MEWIEKLKEWKKQKEKPSQTDNSILSVLEHITLTPSSKVVVVKPLSRIESLPDPVWVEPSLPLKAFYARSVAPYSFEQPIESYAPSSKTVELCREHGKVTLKDIRQIKMDDWVHLKGFGQGHVEEVCQLQLRAWESLSKELQGQVDMLAFLRATLAGMEEKKQAAFIKALGLEEATPPRLSTPLPPETQEEWYKEVITWLKNPKQQERALYLWKMLFDAKVLPWIYQREGVASCEEIIERLLQVSIQKKAMFTLFNFFSSEILEKPLHQFFLYEIQATLWAVDPFFLEKGRWHLFEALSYFPTNEIEHDHDALIKLIARAALHHDTFVSVPFIQKTLYLSQSFEVYRHLDSRVRIKRSSK